jgi:hypothetical protein
MKITRDRLAAIIREEMTKLDERGPVGDERGPEEDDPGMIEEEDLEEDAEKLEEEEGLEEQSWEKADAPDTHARWDRYRASGAASQGGRGKSDKSSYSGDFADRYEKSGRFDENKKLTKEALRKLVEKEIENIFRKK